MGTGDFHFDTDPSDPAAPNDDRDDPGPNLDALGDLDFEADYDLDPLPGENGIHESSGSTAQFDVAQESDIQDARVRRRGVVSKQHDRITEEDFDDEDERDAFLLVNGHKCTLFENGYTAREKAAAIRFFFGESSRDLVLRDALLAISESIRIDVFRLRLVYEMYLTEFRVNAAFGFDAAPCPDLVVGNAGWICGDTGKWIVAEAWQQPGISKHELLGEAISRMPRPFGHQHKGDADEKWVIDKVNAVVDRLTEEWMIGTKVSVHDGRVDDFLYVIGRNPVLEQEEYIRENQFRPRAFSYAWSRLF
ncbi:hypothetical protein [Burkholderia anthina]|uniref:hypothetical protein n=1 Tax=Burkholderia anthina TaxID=179879 RepID=UPI0015888ED2|nr:hypothetical protein [Burkholderia anthina]